MLIASAICILAIIIQFGSILVVVMRLRGKRTIDGVEPEVGVSILRPVCGIENFVEETLLSTFRLEYPRFEIIFCAADVADPAVAIVQKLIDSHPHIDARVLIGKATFCANPKLSNLAKGWRAARYEWILMADSNVLMPKDHLQRMLSVWREDTGLVCSPPVGSAAGNFWAELECAFLNTYQARWQCFADSIGLGFAQGKAMLWRRELLEAAGGIEALGGEMAEDAAATKIVRSLGLRVRLVTRPFPQPLGHRRALDVWHRQVRWARLRRMTFRLYFVPELFVGIVPPLLAAIAVAAQADWPIAGAAAGLIVAWYAAELLLARRAGWPISYRSVFAWMLRDTLLPVLWLAAWAGDGFEWRGNAMSAATFFSHSEPQSDIENNPAV